MKLNKLKYFKCYLIGSIESSDDFGIGWRKDITEFLKSRNIIVLDPCNKAIDLGLETKHEVEEIKKLKEQEKYEEIREKYKIIRQVDLRQVDVSDFTIFYLDIEKFTTGSMEEFFWSNRMKKPSLIICKQGRKNIPSWFYLCIPPEHTFNNFDELKQYITNIDEGKDERTFNRWVFFDYYSLYEPLLKDIKLNKFVEYIRNNQ